MKVVHKVTFATLISLAIVMASVAQTNRSQSVLQRGGQLLSSLGYEMPDDNVFTIERKAYALSAGDKIHIRAIGNVDGLGSVTISTFGLPNIAISAPYSDNVARNPIRNATDSRIFLEQQIRLLAPARDFQVASSSWGQDLSEIYVQFLKSGLPFLDKRHGVRLEVRTNSRKLASLRYTETTDPVANSNEFAISEEAARVRMRQVFPNVSTNLVKRAGWATPPGASVAVPTYFFQNPETKRGNFVEAKQNGRVWKSPV